jgi:peptidoglycan/xylan/chitin deacetylase (PgdA/CDA1 family)
MSTRMRLVVFTAGPLSAVDHVFCERLARDPLLDLRAVVVDSAARPRPPRWRRIRRGVQQDGWPWLWFKAVTTMEVLAGKVALALFDRLHRPIRKESYETLSRGTGVAVHHVADIRSQESLALIRSLRPQLGVIVGSCTPGDAVISIPEHGTVNVEKGMRSEGQGDEALGYREVMAGEGSIGLTVHRAAAPPGERDVLGEAAIPIEECDTLGSLHIKADLAGARLCHDAILAVVRGRQQGTSGSTRPARTDRAPSEFRVWQLERRLRLRAARLMPLLRTRPGRLARARVLLQYLVVSPLLFGLRRRLQRQRRSPVCVLFYHLVANRPLNHMCLPLEEFVRQMELLQRYCPLVSLEEAAARLSRDGRDEVAVAVTFDDGYRDNAWAIEYLRYFDIPACFFVSIGHVLDGSAFEHDRQRGFDAALPFGEEDVRRLAAEGFEVGSHGLYHEDFGTLDAETADRVLCESRRLIERVTGTAPDHFSFPKGQAGTNITADAFAAALRHYRHVYSAYGGYNVPGRQCREHLLRVSNPPDFLELATILDGYTGLRQCLVGNAWGLKTSALAPYVARTETGRSAAPHSGRLLQRSGR